MSNNDDSFEYEAEPESSGSDKQQPPKKKSGLPLLLGIAGLLIVAGVVAFSILDKSKKTDQPIQQPAEVSQGEMEKTAPAEKPTDSAIAPQNTSTEAVNPVSEETVTNGKSVDLAAAPKDPSSTSSKSKSAESNSRINLSKTDTKAITEKSTAATVVNNVASRNVETSITKNKAGGNEKVQLNTIATNNSELIVLFKTNSSNVSGQDKKRLKGKADSLKAQKRTVIVNGYTDSVGSDQYNINLSQRRADQVKSILAEAGLTDVKSKGHGEGNPIASNDSDDGKRQNRRVEIMVSN